MKIKKESKKEREKKNKTGEIIRINCYAIHKRTFLEIRSTCNV